MKKLASVVFTGLVISGCSSVVTEQTAAIDQLTPCNKIQTLLGAYDTRFESLKTTKVTTKFMDSWSTNYHLVGQHCQITAFDHDNVIYRCQNSYKEQVAAVTDHQKAVAFTRQCLLESNWHESQKESKNSIRTTFVLDENTPVISIYTGKTLSSLKSWSTSLEIGKSVATKQ